MIYFLPTDRQDTSYSGTVFGQGFGATQVRCLRCSGTEYRLADCGSYMGSRQYYDRDWGVTCKNGDFW